MGVDNSGKTTLARNLIEVLNDKGFNFNYMPPLGKAPLEIQVEHSNSTLFSNKDLIIDRLPVIEEEVIGRILRGKNNFDKINKDKIFEYYNNIDMIIFCNPPLEVITDWGDRAQMDGVKENAAELQAAYEELFFKLIFETKGMKMLFADYDWRSDVTGRRLRGIIKLIEEMLEDKKGEK